MNCVTLTGNICKDIKLYSTTSGKEYIDNTIAVARDIKNQDGTRTSDFINFVVFGITAKYLSDYGKKGDKIEIQGSLRIDKYQDKEGNNKQRSYVYFDKLQILT